MAIEGKVQLEIHIEGVSLQFINESVKSVQITSSLSYSVPLLRLVVYDLLGVLGNAFPLADGTKIAVSIGFTADKRVTIPFRLFSFERLQDGGSLSYQIDAYYDAPGFFIGSTSSAFHGNSSDVLFQIASKNKIIDDLDKTADKQIWYGMNERTSVFAANIAKHGYVDEQSSMSLGFTESGVLRYKNISKISWKNATVLVQGDGGIPIVDRSVINKSGLNNIYDGYGSTLEEQSVTAATSKYSSSLHNRVSKHLLMNPDLEMPSRVRVAPVDCGNTHKNYFKALYQNRRLQSRYTVGVYTMHTMPTGLVILDPAVLQLVDASGVRDEIYSGNYIVTAKTISIKGSDYYEKLGLYSDGINKTFTNKVK